MSIWQVVGSQKVVRSGCEGNRACSVQVKKQVCSDRISGNNKRHTYAYIAASDIWGHKRKRTTATAAMELMP